MFSLFEFGSLFLCHCLPELSIAYVWLMYVCTGFVMFCV